MEKIRSHVEDEILKFWIPKELLVLLIDVFVWIPGSVIIHSLKVN